MASGESHFTDEVAITSVDLQPLSLKITRATVTLVPDNAETTVIAYVSAADEFLDAITATGTFSGEFRLYINSTHIETKRIEVSYPDAVFMFPKPMPVSIGTTIDIKVIHYDIGNTHSFESTIKVHP